MHTCIPFVVHKTLKNLQMCKSNTEVTGLPETDDAEYDCNQFVDFGTEHLSTKPHVTGCC